MDHYVIFYNSLFDTYMSVPSQVALQDLQDDFIWVSDITFLNANATDSWFLFTDVVATFSNKHIHGLDTDIIKIIESVGVEHVWAVPISWSWGVRVDFSVDIAGVVCLRDI